MRIGWRGAGFIGMAVVLLGMAAQASSRPSARAGLRGEAPIRLTLDVTWGNPDLPELPSSANPDPSVVLEIGGGRVIDARPLASSTSLPHAQPDGSWKLGSGASGRVRVRVETTAGAEIMATAGGSPTRFAVATLIDSPLKTGVGSPIPVLIERVPWDALEVTLGQEDAFDGTVAPGVTLPAALGFNILSPEPTEVVIRYTAEVRPARGASAIWTLAPHQEVVKTNATPPAGSRFSILTPRAEGTYVLEVKATWEPSANAEGSRLGRLLKWRRNGNPHTITRTTSFTVVNPKAPSPPNPSGADSVVDSVDLTRSRGLRTTASGRSPATGSASSSWAVPESAVVEASRRDRLRGWISRGDTEVATLGSADSSGLAWSALPLRVNHPGRPHRLTVTVAGGIPSDLAVALLAPRGADGKPRVLLDAAASGPAVGENASPFSFSWPVWPDSAEMVIVVVNRSGKSGVRLGLVELRELAADPSPAVLSEVHAEAPRPLALHLAAPGGLDRFGGTVEAGPDDTWNLANNLAAYALHCGASTVILPDDLNDRALRASLDGQADEDASGADRLDVILRVLARKNVTAMLETRFDAPLPGLALDNSADAIARGLVRVDRFGKADGTAYQPLHPDVRQAMTKHASMAVAPRASHPNLLGLVVRLGPGATLPGGPEVGLDDATFPRFVRASFQKDQVAKVPGMDASSATRFLERWKFVTGPGRKDWLDWRASQIGLLYTEMARGVSKAQPGAILAVVTPGLDDGPAGEEARRVDHALLSPSQAWKNVGLDLKLWPIERGGSIVLRGVGLSTDDLGRDLATTPDLDESVAARPGRGLWMGECDPRASAGASTRLTARPIAYGPAGEEPLGHALAVLDARFVVISGTAAAGQEERIARFARVLRALPAPVGEIEPPSPRLDSGVAVRSWVVKGQTFVAMANDTPYKIYLESVLHAPAESVVDDLGRRQRLVPAAAPGGGKSLVLELPPFGVAALRISGTSAKVVPIGPYLPSAREIDVQYEKLSARLAKLAQGGPASGPANSGFEDSARPLPSAEIRPGEPETASVAAWSVEGDPANRARRDETEPRSGRSAMRLDAAAIPASVVSEAFFPPGRTSILLRAWIRADAAETPAKIWIEGEAAGAPFRRSVDVTLGPEWAEYRLQADDLPAGGPDKVRIRFERTTPGKLWIDDVSATGDGAPQSARRAQLTLKAALHAYREKRYADFARFSASHWARQFEPEPPEPATAERPSPPIRTGNAATDLPSGRRLR